jgi:hypothetical protein
MCDEYQMIQIPGLVYPLSSPTGSLLIQLKTDTYDLFEEKANMVL